MAEPTPAHSHEASCPDVSRPGTGRADVDCSTGSSLPFDRRSTPRLRVSGSATLFPLDGEQFGDILELRMLDYGEGGFAGLSSRPIESGTAVSVGFEDSRLVAWRGVVLRCDPPSPEDEEPKYRIAVRFEASLAA